MLLVWFCLDERGKPAGLLVWFCLAEGGKLGCLWDPI